MIMFPRHNESRGDIAASRPKSILRLELAENDLLRPVLFLMPYGNHTRPSHIWLHSNADDDAELDPFTGLHFVILTADALVFILPHDHLYSSSNISITSHA